MLIRRNETFPALSRIFGDFFDREFSDWTNTNYSATNTTLPAVNIKTTEDNFIVEVAVPGMKKEDFKIDLKDNNLTISSEKEENKEVTEGEYTRKEYSYQSFSRSFSLPNNIIDSDNISAKYENGELKITIPKKEEAKPKEPRKIDIL
ncbi:MAG: Hsp20/alpha crystallin family protein [Bacteroidales bacterium]|nr:Hsp20/alpha crystallin family protein [Bacteroidales bacterium]MBN2757920.1 Hsp20/alpha crystallin family protein [Bacteroidales bacterium]